MSKSVVPVAAFGFALAFAVQCSAEPAPEAEYKKTYDSAVALQNEARSYQNGWTVTTAALASAKRASDAHDFVNAARLAKNAEALAKASVEQAKRQKKLWKDAVVR
jgi:hypothetical protein